MRRIIRLEGTDQEFELTKATAINSDSVPFLLHVDRMPDGTYRLTYNAKLIPDFTKVVGVTLTIAREDD